MPRHPTFEKSWALFDEARQLIPLGTGTNSKSPVFRDQEPAYFIRGSGCRLWDIDGNCFIDFRAALGPISLGYDHPAVRDAVAAQVDGGWLFSGPHPLEVEVARELVRLVPAAEQVRYLKTGGEAMAAAIKLARAYTQRDIVLSSGYHGWLQTLEHQKGIPLAVSQLTLTYPYGDLAAVEKLLDTWSGQVAAVTLAGAYPAMIPNDPFPRRLAELAHSHGTLLIVDEIVTGFRLAYGGWHEYYGVTPDLAVFGKGLANGLPLSVYLGRREIMEQAGQDAVVSSTFSGETLSLAATKATLNVYCREPVIEHLWARGQQLRDGLSDLFLRHRLPVRMQGLPPCPRFVFDLGPDRNARLRAALFCRAIQRGVLLFDVPYVSYSHGEADIEETLQRLHEAWTNLDVNNLPELAPSTARRIGASAD